MKLDDRVMRYGDTWSLHHGNKGGDTIPTHTHAAFGLAVQPKPNRLEQSSFCGMRLKAQAKQSLRRAATRVARHTFEAILDKHLIFFTKELAVAVSLVGAVKLLG